MCSSQKIDTLIEDPLHKKKNRLNISYQNNKLFFLTEKRYDIPYQFALIPIRINDNKLLLQSDRIHEFIELSSITYTSLAYW